MAAAMRAAGHMKYKGSSSGGAQLYTEERMSRLSVEPESPARARGGRDLIQELVSGNSGRRISIELSAVGVKEAEKQTVRVRSHSALSHREYEENRDGEGDGKRVDRRVRRKNDATNSRKEGGEIQER